MNQTHDLLLESFSSRQPVRHTFYDPRSYFSTDYRQARERFLTSTNGDRWVRQHHRLPLHLGASGEELFTDVAFSGAPNSGKLLILSSGTHGVEGFCGSGCQIAALNDESILELALANDVSLLFIHAINPFGFSHRRRFNEDSIDINRNFISFVQPRPPNEDYLELHRYLIPDCWPPSSENEEEILKFVNRRGLLAYQAAVMSGQYTRPDGLFYGGAYPSWSAKTLRAIIAEHASQASCIGWMDYHSGLGPYGFCEKMAAGADNASNQLARKWWGMDVAAIDSDDCVSSEVVGSVNAALSEAPDLAKKTFIAMEYGVVTLPSMLSALRAEQWLWNHRLDVVPSVAEPMKQALVDSFYADDPLWQGPVLAQSRVAIIQAIRGLAHG